MHAAIGLLAGMLLPLAAARGDLGNSTVASSDSGKPTVYLIRHGEKPAKGDGLSPAGVQRSECLKNVFGPQSQYDIKYIMAENPQKDGSDQRPYDTILPLSQELGINVDISCDRDDEKCVQKVVDGYKGPGNILICWEHQELTKIAQQLGAKNAPTYPDNAFNFIWTDPSPYNQVTSITSENCPGLDGGKPSKRMEVRQW